MDNKWKVYVHTNKINGKRYVGVTSKNNPNHRWNSGRGYNTNPRFFSAIKKYSWDGFYHQILHDGLSQEEAFRLEKAYIAMWQTQDDEFGYNMTSGGEGTSGYRPSDETRRKLSIARRKENLSAETLKRRSDALKGRKFFEDHKRKIGIGNSKKINMLSLDGEFLQEFESAQSAEMETGISHSHISQCCNNRRKTTGGYKWCFA